MKKLFGSFIASGFFICLMWLVMFQLKYDDLKNVADYHLDLMTMLNRVNITTEFNKNFAQTYKEMMNAFQLMDNASIIGQLTNSLGLDSAGAWIAIKNVLEAAINPLYAIAYPIMVFGYLLSFILNFLGMSSIVATAIFDFIFDPVFIKNYESILPPIIDIPSIPPIIPPIRP